MGRSFMVTLQRILVTVGSILVSIVSYVVFSFLDLLDPLLCVVYKLFDYFFEAEWKPCYCYSVQEDCSRRGRILVTSTEGKTKIVCHCLTKLQLDDISETLYTRKPLFRELMISTAFFVRKLSIFGGNTKYEPKASIKHTERLRTTTTVESTFHINSTIAEILQGNRGQQTHIGSPRWSDCDCKTCASWHSLCKETLYVRVDGQGSDFGVDKDNNPKTCSDVIFIHGFISSSTFWTETLFPNFSESAKSAYRLFAVDLLGFGRSPKPMDSLYTLREHVDMIEHSIV